MNDPISLRGRVTPTDRLDGTMDAQGLRRAWNDFFAAKAHTLLPSSSLIPTHPTAPMLTHSGMMQFVPVFMGEEPVTFEPARPATVQKFVRAGRRHNDLEAMIGRATSKETRRQ